MAGQVLLSETRVLATFDIEGSVSQSARNEYDGVFEGTYSGSGGSIVAGFLNGNARAFANGDTAFYSFPLPDYTPGSAPFPGRGFTIGCFGKFSANPSSTCQLIAVCSAATLITYITVDATGVIHAGAGWVTSGSQENATIHWPTDSNWYEARIAMQHGQQSMQFLFGPAATVLPVIGTVTPTTVGDRLNSSFGAETLRIHPNSAGGGGVAGIDNPYFILGPWTGASSQRMGVPKHDVGAQQLRKGTLNPIRPRVGLSKAPANSTHNPSNGFAQGLG